VAGRSSEHFMGFVAHRQDFPIDRAYGNDRRLGEHNSFPAPIDESVGGSEVDADFRDEAKGAKSHQTPNSLVGQQARIVAVCWRRAWRACLPNLRIRGQ